MSDNKRVEDKIDKIVEDISEIKVTMARNTGSLETHIRRTELLEGRLEPVEKQSNMILGAAKLIGIIAAIAAIVEVIVNLK